MTGSQETSGRVSRGILKTLVNLHIGPGLWKPFAVVPASSNASIRGRSIARRVTIPPTPPTLLNLQGISVVSKKLGSVGGVGGATD